MVNFAIFPSMMIHALEIASRQMRCRRRRGAPTHGTIFGSKCFKQLLGLTLIESCAGPCVVVFIQQQLPTACELPSSRIPAKFAALSDCV